MVDLDNLRIVDFNTSPLCWAIFRQASNICRQNQVPNKGDNSVVCIRYVVSSDEIIKC